MNVKIDNLWMAKTTATDCFYMLIKVTIQNIDTFFGNFDNFASFRSITLILFLLNLF